MDALHLSDLPATQRLGQIIAHAAAPGDVIGLVGGLGAGKTTLTQAIGAGLGLPPHAVASPTFTLLAEHRSGRMPLYHLDVYRLSHAHELEHLGIDDYLLACDGLMVLEWADRVPEALPDDRLTIHLATDPNAPQARRAILEAGGPLSSRLRAAVYHAWQEAG